MKYLIIALAIVVVGITTVYAATTYTNISVQALYNETLQSEGMAVYKFEDFTSVGQTTCFIIKGSNIALSCVK